MLSRLYLIRLRMITLREALAAVEREETRIERQLLKDTLRLELENAKSDKYAARVVGGRVRVKRHAAGYAKCAACLLCLLAADILAVASELIEEASLLSG